MSEPTAWDRVAPGWGIRRAEFEEFAAPVAHWLVEAIEPQPGQRVLELAAGVGETGFLAAELLAPGGRLICTDASEQMLAQARVRAAEFGLPEDVVEFKSMHGEWLDAPLASLDAVICRFGLMLMEDPAAALRECRRALRPGGRLALAVWGARERNAVLGTVGDVLAELGLAPGVGGAAPGPFSLAVEAELRELIAGAGFADVLLEPIELVQRATSFERWWEGHLDLSLNTRAALEAAGADQGARVRDAARERLRVHTAPDGSLAVPALALCASAEA